MTAKDVLKTLQQKGSPQKAKNSAWFFKTAPGQYGYGDRFLGVTVPEQRKIAKSFRALPLPEVKKLLTSGWHECRLTAVFILGLQYQKADSKFRKQIVEFYLHHTQYINNWDIVDSSAEMVNHLPTLQKLAKSKLLWERRIAMVATFGFTKQGDPEPALEIAAMLLNDKEDLMHKAVGWMLREVGKRCSPELLRNFLKQHVKQMPRTTLRYAIEHFPATERKQWLAL